MRLTYPELGILPVVDLATGRTSEQGRVHKIAYYPHISYKLSQFNTVYTQNVLALSVISNSVYPPLLKSPPCFKVHQLSDTHYQGAHNHIHNEQHILGPLMMV